jgi:hypothetical protein
MNERYSIVRFKDASLPRTIPSLAHEISKIWYYWRQSPYSAQSRGLL